MKILIFVFLITLIRMTTQTTIDLHFLSDLESNYGLGWPHELSIMEGHDALLKLIKPLDNMEKCEITTVKGVTFNVTSPPSDRFEKWGDGCGIRLRHVTKADEGRWRMTASNGDTEYTGFSKVSVLENTMNSPTEPIELEDGAEAVVNLTIPAQNTYCVVTQPFAESSLVPGQCLVNLDRTTRAIQGDWSVVLGVTGRVQEYSIQRKVFVEAERLDVGFVHDRQANKIHLYCNILNTHKTLDFCRFQMTSKPTGHNVLDGLSDGKYSYFGDGFYKKHCGLTVEEPTAEDFGTWRCSVGVSELVGANIVQRNPMQALISVPAGSTRTKKVVIFSPKSREEVRSIFVQKGREITINCRAEVSLSYCWFHSPDGKQYSPVSMENKEQEFWYTGEGLSMGDCGITFAHATEEFTGTWTCHMGPRTQLGLELTDNLQVRVTGALAAYNKELEADIGDPLTLYCLSASGNRPLDYCRFLSPSGLGINVDSTVTAEHAILGRYYFTPGRETDHGDCSININALEEQDIGVWSCAGVVSGEILEALDTIQVSLAGTSETNEEDDIPSRTGISRAGVLGMVFGILALGFVLVGYVWHKRGRPVPWRTVAPNTVNFPIDLDVQTPRSSNSSEETSASGYVRHWRRDARN